MRPGILAVTVVWCAAGVGCGTFFQDAARNILETPIRAVDDCRISRRNHCLAAEAWDAVEAQAGPKHFSPDYACGFKDGFADYLESGGDGLPPAVPPFRYRLSRYQTPQGIHTVEEWYEGFRHGAAAARASGLREKFLVQLSAPPINAVAATQAPSPPSPALDARPTELGAPTLELLPLPRLVPSPAREDGTLPSPLPLLP